MKSRFSIGRWILVGVVAAVPQIAAAAEGVTAGGDAVAAIAAATRRIARDFRRDTEDQAKRATAEVIRAALIAAAPEQSQAILDAALTNLPPPLQRAAIRAARAALSPAAGARIWINRTTCIAPNKGLPCRTWRVPLTDAR